MKLETLIELLMVMAKAHPDCYVALEGGGYISGVYAHERPAGIRVVVVIK